MIYRINLDKDDLEFPNFVRWAAFWLLFPIVIGFILTLIPMGLWLLIPFLALYLAGYRIVSAKSNDWMDDVEEYLAATEENK